MSSPAADLQKAIFQALLGTLALTAMVADRIFDHAPAAVAFPYLSFGRASQYDWSTDMDTGTEHLLTINVWSKGRGRKQALDLAELVRARLHDATLTLDGHRLINLRLETSEIRFDQDLDVYQGVLRFRAVTEPLA